MDDPKQIGRYEILGELGKGAMGKVYRAQDPNIGRIVALKTMRLDVHGADDAEILRRFKHEAKLAGVLNHPNIVTIYDAGEFEGVFYMAMEYLEGATLQSTLHDHRTLPADRIVEISRQVCAGLDNAHKHGVIHRDIKPANIMITSQDVVKIMDFGIAKSSTSMTTAGQVLGTPTYMSPEQVRGKALDGRSDIFSFGVVLYEMVVGEKPFTGQTITTIIYKIIHEAAIPPRELDVTVHPGISAIIMKALAKSPEERYQTGADLVRDLMNYKSFGSDAESTKIIAAVANPGHVQAAASKPEPTRPAPASPVLVPPVLASQAPTAKAPIPAAIKSAPTSAHKTPVAPSGESTVGVGIRIGNKPLHAVPPPPAPKNIKLAMIGVGSLLVLLLIYGVTKWKGHSGDSQETAQVAAPTQQLPAENQPVKPKEPLPSPDPDKNEEPALKTTAVKKAEKATATAKKSSAENPKTVPATVVNPPAAESADKGGLQITSTPAGARVTISGPTPGSGTTPLTLTNLEPGNYSISLAKSGYATQSRNVRIFAGRTATVGSDLVAAEIVPSKLIVNSTPPGAEITLDGKSTGKVTPSSLSVSHGEHKIALHKGGYQDVSTEAKVKEGETHTFAPTLEAVKPTEGGNPFRALRGLFGSRIPEGKGMLNIHTTPEGAEIFHNGEKAPKLTPLKWPMEPGSYRVTLKKEGFKTMQKDFAIEKGKTTDLNLVLEKK